MKLKSDLEHLSAAVGVSGFEKALSKQLAKMLAPYTDTVKIDALGSVIAFKKGKTDGAKKIMLDAHLDEIGLIVTKIDEKGFLKFTAIGGVDERILPSAQVVVHGREDLPGVIGIKPPHIQAEGENKKTLKLRDLAIDIGYDEKQANALVRVGDFVSFQRQPGTLQNGFVSGKCLDNRAGVAVLLEVARQLAGEETDADIFYVFSVQEENNLGGAKAAAYGIGADAALVIDVTHAKTHDNKDGFDAGKGVAYSVGPNVCPALERRIKKWAKKENIPVFPEVDGGSTGTNAWSVQIAGAGVLTAVLSVPLKYMHTPTEVVSLEDLRRAVTLAATFARKASKAVTEERDISLC